jgi:hypothetical protein
MVDCVVDHHKIDAAITRDEMYQSLIGILRWIVELGWVDICCEMSMLSSHLALPPEGHLQQVYHMFAYMKYHHNAEMVFDPTEPEVVMADF